MIVEHTFTVQALCPADGKLDVYTCMVRSCRMIAVEDILKVADEYMARKIYQEDLTADLARRLGAQVETVGFHSCVRTRVVAGLA